MNLTPLFFMQMNWILSMAMLMTPLAIDGMAKMAKMAFMGTFVMTNVSMAMRGIQLKSITKLAQCC